MPLTPLKGGKLYILNNNTSAFNIKNINTLNQVFPDQQITVSLLVPSPNNVSVKWVFQDFVVPKPADGINIEISTLLRNSGFPFYKYFTLIVIGNVNVQIELIKGIIGFPGGISSEIDFFVALGNTKIEVQPLKELLSPIKKFITTFKENIDILKPKKALTPNKNKNFPANNLISQISAEILLNEDTQANNLVSQSLVVKKTTLYYFTLALHDPHFNNTLRVLGSDIDIKFQIPIEDSDKAQNSYFAFAKIFMDASQNDIVFLNHSIKFDGNKDIPVVADPLILDMINYFSTSKNLTVVISAGNSLQSPERFNIDSFFVNGLVSKAIIVGAVKKSGGKLSFDSNFSNTLVDFYVKTPYKEFGHSSAASAYIARKVKDVQDKTNGKFHTVAQIKELLRNEATVETIDGITTFCFLNP